MPPHANLISDSFLITETVQLLQSFGGRVPAVKIVNSIMRMSNPEPDLARTLISDLIENDPRLKLTDDFVELIENNVERRKFSETDFVVFDLETTGAKTPPCRITEIGAFKIQNGKITDKFETLINPEAFIPPFIVNLTGINNNMVKRAPRFWEVAEVQTAFSHLWNFSVNTNDWRVFGYLIGRGALWIAVGMACWSMLDYIKFFLKENKKKSKLPQPKDEIL